MSSLTSAPGARRLLVLSILARLPLVMLGIGLLVHTEHLTGSFAAAGAVTGVYAIALAVGGPLLGRLVDRRGQRPVLLASAAAAAVQLLAVAALPAGAPLAALLALAAGIGLATPPVGACVRTLLPGLLPDAGAVRAAYALDASASELTWIAGPPLALGLGALWSTGAALALAGVALLVATAAFAFQPASRTWRPAGDAPRPRGGSLGSPAMRTLVLVLIAVGVLFGAVEVAVTAVAKLHGGSTAAAAPLLALWGAGSLAGGVLAARVGAPALVPLLGALAAGHLALVAAAGSLAALGAVLFVAGAAIAPTLRRGLRDGRRRRAGRHRDRGVCVAGDRDRPRRRARCGGRRGARRPRRTVGRVRAGRSRGHARPHHGAAALRRAARRPQPSVNGSLVAPRSARTQKFGRTKM